MDRTQGTAGFFGASSMERLPTERAIADQLRAFKQLPRPTDATDTKRRQLTHQDPSPLVPMSGHSDARQVWPTVRSGRVI
ncbi:phosphoenolpyruvate hydrolase family protein [Streptomyces sp. MnatMP-M27]|uniref:phosphoenolpyruvate hydrolase family protein n=1 Tax=Streptomyces sp. MnatMP-M27 TaxID=1839768 RepID=UPI00210BD890|nr:phosphoenolpyruvate hydrolase family protein [Streptomyces sp. MnatMP-M27]